MCVSGSSFCGSFCRRSVWPVAAAAAAAQHVRVWVWVIQCMREMSTQTEPESVFRLDRITSDTVEGDWRMQWGTLKLMWSCGIACTRVCHSVSQLSSQSVSRGKGEIVVVDVGREFYSHQTRPSSRGSSPSGRQHRKLRNRRHRTLNRTSLRGTILLFLAQKLFARMRGIRDSHFLALGVGALSGTEPVGNKCVSSFSRFLMNK